MSSDASSTTVSSTRRIRGDEIAAIRLLRQAMEDIFRKTEIYESHDRHACVSEALATLRDQSLTNGESALQRTLSANSQAHSISSSNSQNLSDDLKIMNIFSSLGRPVSIDAVIMALVENGLTVKKPSFSTKLARWAQNGWLKRFAPGVYSLTEEGQKERTKRLAYE